MDTKLFRVYIWLYVTVSSFPRRYFVRVIRNFPFRTAFRKKRASRWNESLPPFVRWKWFFQNWIGLVVKDVGDCSLARLSTLSNRWFPRFMKASWRSSPDNVYPWSKSRVLDGERAEIRRWTLNRRWTMCFRAFDRNRSRESNNLMEIKFNWKFSSRNFLQFQIFFSQYPFPIFKQNQI